ncbi:MAG: hypothetical protein JSR60_13440 [Proteobacteria bacterium]|nr:hypothetical protein [Pseudomonadota bacterium]
MPEIALVEKDDLAITPLKAAWQKPRFHKVYAEDIETGINLGPEIVLILS